LSGGLPAARSVAVRTLRDPASHEVLDEAIVVRFDGPASATGEDVVELQCHGGRAVVDRLLVALGSVNGLRAAEPGEFTRRAFANGRIDLTEAEGLADLLEAQTESQRKAALAVADGGLRRQIEGWQERLLGLAAAAERAIDYDEDDVELDHRLPAACEALASELEQWLQRPRAEPLKDGVLVVIAGPPNAGKSSLINAMAGEDRSIVTDVPGTTRDYVEVALAIDGIPVRLTDTAGLRDTADRVEAIGVARSRRLIDAADVLVWLGDAGNVPPHARAIMVHPRSDIAGREPCHASAIATSVVTGEGLTSLMGRIRVLASQVLPGEEDIALNRRQAENLQAAEAALRSAAAACDYPILAEELRHARAAFDRVTGRAGVGNLLDELFSRFCLGK